MSENKDDVLGSIRERDKREGFYVKVDDFLHENHGLAVMDRRSLLAIVDSQSSTIESLRRELDAVRRDGERYQACVKHGFPTFHPPKLPRNSFVDPSMKVGTWTPANWSFHVGEQVFIGSSPAEVIDAAISEARGRE